MNKSIYCILLQYKIIISIMENLMPVGEKEGDTRTTIDKLSLQSDKVDNFRLASIKSN